MPYSGITQSYIPEQGRKSLRFKQELREFLNREGLSETGIRELLAHQPLSSESDRQSIHGVLVRMFRERAERNE